MEPTSSSRKDKPENKVGSGRPGAAAADNHEERIQKSSGRRQVFSDISNVPSSGGSVASTAGPSSSSKSRGSKSKGFVTTPKSRYDCLLEPGKSMPKGQILFKCPKCTGPFLTPESSISSVNRRPNKLEEEGDNSEKSISTTANIETNRLSLSVVEEKNPSFLIPRDKRTPTAFKREISSINNLPALEQQNNITTTTTPNLPSSSSITTPSYSIADSSSSSLSCSFQSLNTTCSNTDLSSISFDILPSPEAFKENRDPRQEMSPFSPIYYNRQQKQQNDQNNDKNLKKNLRKITPPSSPNTRRRILNSCSYSAGCDELRKQVLTYNAIAASKSLSQSISDLQSQSREENENESLQTSLTLQKTSRQAQAEFHNTDTDENDQSKTSEYSSSNFSVLRDASSFYNIHGSDFLLSPQLHGIVMKSFEENENYNKSYSPFNESTTATAEDNSSESQRKRQLSGNNSNDTQLNIPLTSKFCSHKEDKNNSSLSIAQEDQDREEDNDTVLECPLCSHRFCSLCMFIEHPGKLCHLIDSDSLYSESDSSIASNLSSGTTKGKKERKNRLRRLAR